MLTNTLFYGDNLPILREYIADEAVDLVYLDPPFNSNRSYNVLFKDESGHEADAQISAFEDSWHWNETAERTYTDLVQDGPARVSAMIGALRGFIGANQMMAYLVMMAARLVELHRVLKPTGSLYLHCDPTASHYLKIILDSIFGAQNFRDEISWLRSGRRSSISKIYRHAHDVILFYTKSSDYVFNMIYEDKDETLLKKYTSEDARGKYQLVPLMASGRRGGETGKPWRGYDPNTRGKGGMHWLTIHSKLEEYVNQGLVDFPRKADGMPRLKYYLDQNKGVPLSDFWYDIDIINAMGSEGLGYPTQKPVALLERIISASSNEGDIVLDPFCGCGTAIAAAQKLKRKWIGIDVTHLAIALQKNRLKDMFDLKPHADYRVIGEPEDVASAEQLAKEDRYQFQFWALSLVQARPLGDGGRGTGDGKRDGKKGSDRGIDGVISFIDDPRGKPKRALVQVKSGHVKSGDVRDLRGTLEREEAALGIFITLEKATREMEREAVAAGYYHSPLTKRDYPKLQILTIEELLNGAEIKMPIERGTFKKAERVKGDEGKQARLEWKDEG